MWVAWIISLAPCLCMVSANRLSGSITEFFARLMELHQDQGLSRDTGLEPPQMARPTPPLAFSS